MIFKIPDPPPASRYADDGLYGFWLEFDPTAGDSRFKPSIDEIVRSKDYLELVLNPQQITWDEPFATAITPMQDGGKHVEAKGQLIKHATILGTTGWFPKKAHPLVPSVSSVIFSGLVDASDAAETSRAERSGFKAFNDLCHLFRRYGVEQRNGNTVRMHFMDFKLDEFWLIEPGSFGRRQSTARRYSYDWEIPFTCLEPSGSMAGRAGNRRSRVDFFDRAVEVVKTPGAVAIGSSLLDGSLASTVARAAGVAPVRTAIRRMRELVLNGQAVADAIPDLVGGFAENMVGAARDVVALWEDGTAAIESFSQVKAASLAALEEARRQFFDAMPRFATFEEMSEGPLFEWNAWALEVGNLVANLAASEDVSQEAFSARMAGYVTEFSDVRGLSGSADDVMPETGTPLPVNPFFGGAGLDAVTDVQQLMSSTGFRAVVINGGETIYDVAVRTMGAIGRYVDLIFANDLAFPYIVPNVIGKPSGTLAWGEYIKVPIRTQTGNPVAAGPPVAPAASFGGSVTATGTGTEVVCTSHDPWRIDQWVGYTVRVISGSAADDGVRFVVSNTEDTLVVNRAWSISPTVGDEFTLTLEEFALRSPSTPEQLAYGRDALLKFDVKNGVVRSPIRAKAFQNSLGDVATVSGFENYIQAMRLCCATPRGSNPYEQQYGLSAPIGRPGTSDLLPLYTFFARQSLLEDPRTEAVRKLRFKFSGGLLDLLLDIEPVNAHSAVSVGFPL